MITGGVPRPAAHANDNQRLSFPQPSPTQRRWLCRGLDQPGGKLPLFDEEGQPISARTVRSCIGKGWAEPWFDNPIKPDWLVCRLTEAGRGAVGQIRTSDTA